MTKDQPSAGNPASLYFGWKVVAAILVVLTFASGLSFYNHAVILDALARHSTFSVESASLAVSVFFLSAGFTGLWVAKVIERFDARLCLTAGAIASGAALASLALVDVLWQLYLVYAVFGMGFAASALVPATTLVARWFHRKRAMALSIASTGLSLGGVVITPICAMLVDKLGLAQAAPIMGGMYLVGMIPITWLWIRPSPASIGLNTDGDSDTDHTAASKRTGDDGVDFKTVIRGRLFWGVSVAYIFLMLAQVGGISHQYGLARQLLTEAQTAMAVAILPVTSIVGRLVGGWVVEQISIRAFAIAMMILQVVSLSLLALEFNPITLCLGLACFGITVGNLLMLQPLLIAEAFGLRAYSRLFSISNLMSSWGTACGPAILGFTYAASQDQYGPAYAVAAVAGFVGLISFLSGGQLRRLAAAT